MNHRKGTRVTGKRSKAIRLRRLARRRGFVKVVNSYRCDLAGIAYRDREE